MLDNFIPNFNFIGNFKFEYPYIFLILLIFIICSKFCKAKNQSYYMPHLSIYNNIAGVNNSLINLLKWCAIVFAIVALASPIKELNTINTKKDGIDIIISLDTSASMRQTRFNKINPSQNRWQVVQDIVQDFISKRINDNIGLVVFGSSVMTASPLSYDKKAQNRIIQGLSIGIVGDKTALINSIATSINILKQRDTKTKIIIAITDGEDTASTIPLQVVVKLAKKYDIKIYTIAIGTTNTYTLDQLSSATKGKTFVALSSDDLKEIYKTIDNLEKSKIERHKIVLKEYFFFYPLFISFLALLLFIYFKNKKS